MKNLEDIKIRLKAYKNITDSHILGYYKFNNGKECSIVIGTLEEGLEHVSVRMQGRKLPTWDEMCEIKDLCWEEEEMVVQIHPKKSEYVNFTEALHLWRPKNGDWSRLNENDSQYLWRASYGY